MLVDFRKAFFPTEDEKLQQRELLNKLHNERILYYISQGFSRQEAEEKINEEIVEYSE